jgi:hypothetical protein
MWFMERIAQWGRTYDCFGADAAITKANIQHRSSIHLKSTFSIKILD